MVVNVFVLPYDKYKLMLVGSGLGWVQFQLIKQLGEA